MGDEVRAAWGRIAAEKFAAEGNDVNDLCSCGHGSDQHFSGGPPPDCRVCDCEGFVE
jgi:hypothetical protein